MLKAVPEEKNENDEEEDMALEQVSLNPMALLQKASSSIITSTKQLISKVSTTGANVVPSLLRSPSSSSVFSGRSRGDSAVDIEMGSPQHQSPAPVISTTSVSDNESEGLQISTDAEQERERDDATATATAMSCASTPLAISTSMGLSEKDVASMETAKTYEGEGEEEGDKSMDEHSKGKHHGNPSLQTPSTEHSNEYNVVTESTHNPSSSSPTLLPTAQPLMRMASVGMKGVEKDISMQEAELIEMEERQRLVAMNARKEEEEEEEKHDEQLSQQDNKGEEEDEIALDSEDEEIITARM